MGLQLPPEGTHLGHDSGNEEEMTDEGTCLPHPGIRFSENSSDTLSFGWCLPVFRNTEPCCRLEVFFFVPIDDNPQALAEPEEELTMFLL